MEPEIPCLSTPAQGKGHKGSESPTLQADLFLRSLPFTAPSSQSRCLPAKYPEDLSCKVVPAAYSSRQLLSAIILEKEGIGLEKNMFLSSGDLFFFPPKDYIFTTVLG